MVFMTLQQHLGHTGNYTKIAIDLERRTGIKQIVVSTAATAVFSTGYTGRPQLVVQDRQCPVAIEQAGPEGYLPRVGPANTGIALASRDFFTAAASSGVLSMVISLPG